MTNEPTRESSDGPGRSGSKTSWLLFAVLALGACLRTIQYVSGVDLWHDELALIRNVEARSLGQLLGAPLDHEQVAPAGFLALLEICSRAFGFTTLGLRLVPWLLGIAALFLFWRVATRFASGGALLAVVAVFAVSPALVWYATSVKPYGTDVAISLLLAWLALRQRERPGSVTTGAWAGVLGGISLLVSFAAVPTAALIGVLLAISWWRTEPRASLRPLALLGVGWSIGAAFAGWYALGQLGTETDEFMREFWAQDFPPRGSTAAAAWLLGRSWSVFAHSIVFFPPRDPVLATLVALPILLAAGGLIAGARDRQLPVALLCAPPLAAWSSAFFGLLPFDQRLGLHATWPVLVLAGLGLTKLTTAVRWRWVPRTLAVLTAVPLVAIVLLAARPPYSQGGVAPRDVLETLAESHQPGDRVYVYTHGRHDMAFYGQRAGLTSWEQGERHYTEPRGYLHEIDALRGEPRVWFFWVRLDRDEPAWMRTYLESIGRELDRIPPGEPDRSGAVLYDLSEPARLSATSAESFPEPDWQNAD